MTARNVVPLPAESRPFLRRRRSEDGVTPTRRRARAAEPAVPAASDRAGHEARVAAAAGAPDEASELLRAQTVLLHAALRQAEELETALAQERDLRRRTTAQLRAENDLLRTALSSLQDPGGGPFTAAERRAQTPPAVVPEQRAGAAPPSATAEPVAADATVDDLLLRADLEPDDAVSRRSGRRRSGRQAGPA